ncbi:hypothetical protein [Acrocarpospora macrocephala]|uniref:hypothetical protein n=1 Tax=Acrocarpospora macrocephala TaxID=150177 RepID=UPI0012D30D51|nr:hypothetical protein [Acrocarpospora macrocephala]
MRSFRRGESCSRGPFGNRTGSPAEKLFAADTSVLEVANLIGEGPTGLTSCPPAVAG